MTKTRRDGRRESSWRAILKRQLRSGLSVRAFCRQENLAESNFYAWRRTIAARDEGAAGRKQRRTKAEPAFVPVTVVGGAEPAGEVVLELDGGRRLRFPDRIAPQRLREIVRAVEKEDAS